MPINQGYDFVLSDLESKQGVLAEEIKQLSEKHKALTQTIDSLRQYALSTKENLPFPNGHKLSFENPSPSSSSTSSPANGRYSGLSTRWAILYLLVEHAGESMGRAEIAKALKDGGITSNALSFASNVSAVLSGMVNDRKEVETVEGGGYQITAHGRDVWEHIKRTSQWAARAR